MVFEPLKTMVTVSGKTDAVPSVQTPPAPKPAPVRSPLLTAVTGKLAFQLLDAEATAPALASATLVPLFGGADVTVSVATTVGVPSPIGVVNEVASS